MTHRTALSPLTKFWAVGLAATMIGASPSQAQDIGNEQWIDVFNTLANQLGEGARRYENVTENQLMQTMQARTTVCTSIGELKVNDELDKAADVFRTGMSKVPSLGEIASDRDQFNRFLQEEDKALEEKGLSEFARELARQNANDLREDIANTEDQTMLELIEQTASGTILKEGVNLLCDDMPSPDDNQKWISWAWASTKFIGGIAVISVNTAIKVPAVSVPSIAIGTVSLRNGFEHLDSLTNTEIEQ